MRNQSTSRSVMGRAAFWTVAAARPAPAGDCCGTGARTLSRVVMLLCRAGGARTADTCCGVVPAGSPPGPGRACSAQLRMTRRLVRGRTRTWAGATTARRSVPPRHCAGACPSGRNRLCGSTPVTGDNSRRALRRHQGKEAAGNRSVRPRGDRRPPSASPHVGSSCGALRDDCGRCAGRAGSACTREPGEGSAGRTGHPPWWDQPEDERRRRWQQGLAHLDAETRNWDRKKTMGGKAKGALAPVGHRARPGALRHRGGG